MKAEAADPRDPRIDEAVLRATRELLVRGRVRRPDHRRDRRARRHQQAGDLPALAEQGRTCVHEAAFPIGEPTARCPTPGRWPTTCAEMLRRTAAAFADPVARAITPGLMAEIAADPALHAALLERFGGSLWRASTTGSSSPRPARRGARRRADPDVLIETLAGATLMRAAHPLAEALDDDWVDHTTDLLMRGIAA